MDAQETTCPACGAMNDASAVLGVLGHAAHVRCRYCGAGYSRTFNRRRCRRCGAYTMLDPRTGRRRCPVRRPHGVCV
jgi:formate dehydrogenase maturation protein FdhE